MEFSDLNIFDLTHQCITECDPSLKVKSTQKLYYDWAKNPELPSFSRPVEKIVTPGRPRKPELVKPGDVPKRSFKSLAGRLRLVHAIAHIEFNAINLALDAVYRFRDMPLKYYTDWLKVAAEEALHFTLLNEYLTKNDAAYGDYDAHNGLWEMAVMTDHDVLVRMALVPRVLEARGLDVTPGMISKLQNVGDDLLVTILDKIYMDEIGHVQIGSHWFNYLCKQRSIQADETFDRLLDEYMKDASFGPFDDDVRMQAGFSRRELSDLKRRNKKTFS